MLCFVFEKFKLGIYDYGDKNFTANDNSVTYLS